MWGGQLTYSFPPQGGRAWENAGPSSPRLRATRLQEGRAWAGGEECPEATTWVLLVRATTHLMIGPPPGTPGVRPAHRKRLRFYGAVLAGGPKCHQKPLLLPPLAAVPGLGLAPLCPGFCGSWFFQTSHGEIGTMVASHAFLASMLCGGDGGQGGPRARRPGRGVTGEGSTLIFGPRVVTNPDPSP